jgi:hypothetical protein
MDLLQSSPKFLSRCDVGPKEIGATEHPLGDARVRQVIKDTPAIAAFDHQPVSA